MIRELFLSTARYYDLLFERVLRNLRVQAARIVPPKDGERVLDVGCGTGTQLAIYQIRGCKVVGIDLSLPMLQVAKSKLGPEAIFTSGDAIRMPYPDDKFDLVISSLFLHQLNFQMQSSVLGEIVRVLKPEGRILFIDFHPREAWSLLGGLTSLLIRTIEFFAGWEHFANSRKFLSQGGIPKLALQHGLKFRKTTLVGNGNLGIYLLNVV